ncbi:hypothetical protein [Streptomyces sp. E-08]|uniref:hypothetical protein n=1 Tax=Streptomyces sp. E-08 TaxID=3404047 RepID=UPI003CFA3D33
MNRAMYGTCGERTYVLRLGAAGAMFPSMPEAGEAEVVAYFEEHGERLPKLAFTPVGAYTGVSVDEDAAEAGELPGVLISPLC